MNSIKRQKEKMNSPGQKVSSILLGKNGGQLLIAPERVKRLSQSRNSTQLWMCLVVNVKSNAVKKQYCIGTWNVKSVNQGKLDVVKWEMTKVSIDILGIRELKWMGMGKFNSNDRFIYNCGQESLGEMD